MPDPCGATGPFGLIAANDEPTPEGGKRPLFNSVKALSAVAGHQWHSCLSSAPSELVSVIIESPLGQTLHLVNLTAEEQAVDISAFDLTACRRKGVVMIAPYTTLEFSLTPTGGGNPAPGRK